MTKEIKAQSVKKNFIFQIIYQVVILVVPLIMAPYLTRTLEDKALGVYSFTYSVANYFVLFAMLGIARHGQRIIAARRDDKLAVRKAFWSLYTVHAVFSVIAIVAFVIFVAAFGGNDKTIYYIQTVYVASALIDITWLFYGLENFKSIVIRNFIVKIGECVLIFWLVKSPADLWVYTLIMVCSVFLGQTLMVGQALASVKPVKFGWADVKEHFKPLFILFIAVAATTLYTYLDRTLIGVMINEKNVSYYDQSNKIINIPKTIIGVICTVLFPRACASIAKGDTKNAKKYMDYSLHFTCLLGFASIFGLLGIANLFSVLYFGEKFAILGDVIVGDVIMALTPNIFIIELGNIIRTQYMVPNNMDVSLTVSYIISAVLNIILTIILIPYLGVYGAVVGTTAAETCGLIIQFVLCRKFLSFKHVVLTAIPYALIGAAMFGLIYVVRLYFNSSWWHLLFQVAVGGISYCGLSAVYLFCLSPIKNNLKNMVRNIFRRKKRAVPAAEPQETEKGEDKEEN